MPALQAVAWTAAVLGRAQRRTSTATYRPHPATDLLRVQAAFLQLDESPGG